MGTRMFTGWRRPAAWLVVAVMLSVCVAAAPNGKVTVLAFSSYGDGAATTAESATRAAVEALSQLPGVSASSVKPAPGREAAHRLLSAGEVASSIAAATGADTVILGTIVRLPTPDAELVIASLAAYDVATREIHLLNPLQSSLPRGAASTWRFEQDLANYLASYQIRLGDPQADVLEAKLAAEGQQLKLRLTDPLPSTASGLVLSRVAPPVSSELTGESFNSPPERLGTARLASSEVGASWFDLYSATPVFPGTRVVIHPATAVPDTSGAETLVVTSRPRGAVVSVGGVVQGATPCRIQVPPEDGVELQVLHPDFVPERRPISATDRANGLVTVQLVAPTAAESPEAPVGGVTMRVESVPPGAEVYVDGERAGITPLVLRGLSGRPHIRLTRPGYRDWTAQMMATGSMAIRAELTPMFGGLRIESVPTGLRVFVDGRPVGLTPLELTNVPSGAHRIQIERGDGTQVVRDVVVRSNEISAVSFGAAEPVTPGGDAPLPDVPAIAPPGGRSVLEPQAPNAADGRAMIPRVAPDIPYWRMPLRIGPIAWQRKMNLAEGVRGLQTRLHVCVASLPEGTLLSLTQGPAHAYVTRNSFEGFAVEYPGLPIRERATWPIRPMPELEGVEIRPAGTLTGPCRIVVRTAPGIIARVHESSTVERLRLILVRE